MELGRFGIWLPYREGTGDAREIESLGFGALWVGTSPTLDQTRPFLEHTSTIPVATGILNVWRNEPADVAAGHARLRSEFGDRFLLGLGIGHPEATSDYQRPLAKMRSFLDELDASQQPVPREEMVIAALGPKMLDLAGERTLGTHPYFTTPEHTRFARERLGPDALVAPEVAVVVDDDPDRAREKARAYASLYLGLTNYVSNLLRFGFSESDVADEGSDRVIDAVIPHGTPEQIAAALEAHFEAGADHVCVQPVGNEAGRAADYRALATVLV